MIEGYKNENIKELIQQIIIEASLILAPNCESWLHSPEGKH